MVDGIYFIASNVGERVLIISHVHDSLGRIKMDLNTANDLEKNITRRDCYIQGTETYGRYFKWTLNCKDVKFALEVSQEKSEVSEENKQEPVQEENERELVYEKNQQKANLYIRQCQALNNDDLVMATEKCIILWTFIPSKGIRVHYIWGVDKDISDKEYWEEIFSKPLAERFLPDSDFDRIINEANIKPDEDNTNLYNLLLDNYIEEKFFLTYYGEILMKKLLSSDKDWLVEKLCKRCINICSYDKDSCDLQSNIQSLSIIAQYYSELIQKNPVIIHKFLSQMTFVVPSVDTENYEKYYNSSSPSPHRHHY
ncbi:3253_t:CDS:2, partial [Gigaspora rosea]